MSSLQPTSPVRNATPVRNIFSDPPLVPLDQYEPSPEEWAAYHARQRAEHDAATGRPEAPEPPSERTTYLPALHWLCLQVAECRVMSTDEGDYYDTIGTVLNDVACVMRGTKAKTIADLVAIPGHRFSGVDLGAVAVPREARTSRVADLLDEHAVYYLDVNSAPARLAAHAILCLSELAEMFGADSLETLWERQAESVNQRGSEDTSTRPVSRFEAWA